jgi:hypothetical protein
MRNVSRTFLIVGAIISILAIFLYIGGAFAMIYTSKNLSDSYIMDAFKEIWSKILGDTDAEKIQFIRLVLFGSGITMIVASVFMIPTAIFCFMARSNPTQGNLILVIVFGVLTGDAFVILAGIFGLIANSQERNRQQVIQQ